MYLLLGELNDPVCKAIFASLEVRGDEARIISQPLRLTWRLDTASSVSCVISEDGTSLLDSEIDGVLVRTLRCRSRAPRGSDELAHTEREISAALLAWLWSLDCPVVNRYPAALWHIPCPPLPFWQSRLAYCGLRALPSLISNVEQEAQNFSADLGDETVYAPLTASSRYRLGSRDQWKKLSAMQRIAPVHLTQASVPSHFACVVGTRVIWEGAPPTNAVSIERAFTNFSTIAGLDFVEIEIARTHGDMSVAAVNADSDLVDFGQTARDEIVLGLVQLLTGEVGSLLGNTCTKSGQRTKR